MGNRHWGGPGGGGLKNMFRHPPAPPGVLPGRLSDSNRHRQVLKNIERQFASGHPSPESSASILEDNEGLGEGDVSRFISSVWDQDNVEGGLKAPGDRVLVEHAEK